MVMGDALAVCLLKLKGFTPDDFARFHPGGALGKKLYMRVADIIEDGLKPTVHLNDTIQSVILEISSKRLGATAVLNDSEDIVGIITDGDLRRMLQKNKQIDELTASNIMSPNPKTINTDKLAVNAFQLMEKKKITQLLVTNDGKYIGMIHLHDILREGII